MEIEGGGSISSSELSYADAKTFFLNKSFPVAYDPSHPQNNQILIRQKDFKTFNYSMPDSLQWITQYVHEK
jgi:hypothetical protein